MGKRTTKKVKKVTKKFTVDCEAATDENIMDLADFEKFLRDRIKVNGKTGQIAGVVEVTRTASSVTITTDAQFAKRYLKYLTKKYLKKKSLREAFRVVATNPNTYKLRWFDISDDLAEDEDEGDE